MHASPAERTRWWGDFFPEIEQTTHWRIGGLSLAVWRGPKEWRLAWDHAEAIGRAQGSWQVESGAQELAEPANEERFVFRAAENPLTITPRLADRPVITSPRLPLFVPAGESAELFVGTPVWVHVAAGPAAIELRELPASRPTDTWFGPNTRVGELCYATDTAAALEATNLPSHAHIAITPLHIRNRADDPLEVNKIKLPVPSLPIFSSATGVLWTPTVDMVREDDNEMATIDFHTEPPAQAGETEMVSGARQKHRRGFLTRSFSGLLRTALQEEDE